MNYQYFITILGTIAIILTVLKLFFTEVEGHLAQKQHSILWYLQFSKPFGYTRAASTILLIVVLYFVSYDAPLFSGLWVIELVIFIAVGIIIDAFDQYLAYHYAKMRFKNRIRESVIMKTEIESAMQKDDTELVYHSLPSYDSVGEIQKFFHEDTHLSFSSVDGGEFVNRFDQLPPITYVVETNVEKAQEVLANKAVKVTSLTPEGTMPFKDGRLDLVVNEIVNYDKYEIHRVLKQGGYFVVEQLGSDNYKELLNMFMPFRVKGRWDKENCGSTLQQIGFEILDSFEDIGYIRFKSLSAIITFINQMSPDKVQRYDLYINFYAHILSEIKRQGFFDLTTHKFMVIARKKETIL